MSDLEPGLYIAREDDPDYGMLLAMTLTGEAKLIGERYDVDAKKEIAASVGMGGELTPNAKVPYKPDPRFFTQSLKEYHNWQSTWWREAIQNAVDAKARNVSCVVEQQSDGTWLVSFQDDGSGMSEDVLVNHFLQPGGSGKEQVLGTAGGFGRAKELLLMPWIAYEVHTRDRIVKGVRDDRDMEEAPYLQGTRVSVSMPADNATTAAAAIAYISKCYIPSVKFTVNGEVVKANLKPGPMIREIPGIVEICHDPKRKDSFGVMIVRVKTGESHLAMFDDEVDPEVKGQVTIEIIGRSTDILASNRDSIRDYSVRSAVQAFGRELASDTKSALRRQKNLIRRKYVGDRFRAEQQAKQREAAILETLGRMEPEGKKESKGARDLSSQQIDVLRTLIGQMAHAESPTGADEMVFSSSAEMADAVLHGLAVRGATHMEAIAKQLAWQPSFYLRNDVEDFTVPKKFRPEGMTRQVRLVANLWAEMCRFVLMQLGSAQEFGVGFCFEDPGDYEGNALAMCAEEEDGYWLLVNPIVGDPRRDDAEILNINGEVKMGKHIIPTDDYLYALAVHECTHMADGIAKHKESFSSALTMNMAMTANKDKQVRALKRIVLAREKETAERLRAEKPVKLAPLADDQLERTRQQRAKGYGGEYYVTFLRAHAHPEGADTDLASLKTWSADKGTTAEIRDDKGKPVWRSEGFDLQLSAPRAKGSATARQALAPLADSDLDRERRGSMAYYDAGTFVAYKEGSRSSWDHGPTLQKLIDDTESYEIKEIRKAPSGDVVWRSKAFNLPLASEGALDALPELADTALANERKNEAAINRGQYVAFAGAQTWSAHADRDFERVKRDIINGGYAFARCEIRAPDGSPVWRSVLFDLPLQDD